MGPYLHVGHAYKGTLAIRRGTAKGEVETLQDCLKHFHAMRYEIRNTETKIALAQGLMAIGQVDKAITLIDDTISQVEENGDFFFMPEATCKPDPTGHRCRERIGPWRSSRTFGGSPATAFTIDAGVLRTLTS